MPRQLSVLTSRAASGRGMELPSRSQWRAAVWACPVRPAASSMASSSVSPVSSAIKDGTPLTLGDAKGRTVVVPGDKIAYVEVGAGERGRLGFSQPAS